MKETEPVILVMQKSGGAVGIIMVGPLNERRRMINGKMYFFCSKMEGREKLTNLINDPKVPLAVSTGDINRLFKQIEEMVLPEYKLTCMTPLNAVAPHFLDEFTINFLKAFLGKTGLGLIYRALTPAELSHLS